MCQEHSIPALYGGSVMHEDIEVPRNFEIRMKCTLPKRQAELAVDGFKVIHCRGYLKLRPKTENFACSDPSVLWYRVIGVVAAGHSLPSASISEVKMHKSDFMFRTGLDFKFIYLEPRVEEIIGYEPSYLIDKSIYKFIHPWDCARLRDVHLLVLTRSQAITKYYRFLTRGGGWIWIQSSCMIISSNKAKSQHYILVLNHVLSGREYEEILLDVEQLHKPRTRSFKSQNNLTKKSHKTRKKTAPSNLNLISNSVHQTSPSQPATTFQESDLNHSKEKHISQTTSFPKNNLESDLLDFETVTRPNSVTSSRTYLSFDNSGMYNYPSCSDFTYNVSSYDNTCSSFINNSPTNAKFNIPSMELNSHSSIVCPNTYNTYFNNEGTMSSLSQFMQNSTYEPPYLESMKRNYLNGTVTDKDLASSCFSSSAKKVKTNELPTETLYTNPIETNYVKDNKEKFTSSSNPPLERKIETNKALAEDFSTSEAFIHTEQNNHHFVGSAKVYVPGSSELIPHPLFHSNDVNYELFSYNNYISSTSWNQSLSVSIEDLKQINNFYLPSDFDSSTSEKQASKRTDVEVIYSSDKSQKSLHDIPTNAINENCMNFNVSQDFKNGALSASKETPVTANIPTETSLVVSHLGELNGIESDRNRQLENVPSNQPSNLNGMTNCEQTIDSGTETMSNIAPDDTPEPSNPQPSIPFSTCNEFLPSNTDHFQNTDNFPVFSDIVNLITNADIFPRLNTDEAYRDLGCSHDSNNNPLQLCSGQSSSNKVIYIS